MLFTRRRRRRSGAVAAIAASALMVVGPGGAVAAPDPDHGPTAGGTGVSDALPARVTFTTVASGGSTAFARGTDGRYYAWGSGSSGELGNGRIGTALAPTAVLPPVELVSVWAGSPSSLARGTDGVLYAWGSNGFGQLGNGTTQRAATPTPVAVPDGVTFVQVATSGTHAIALDQDGTAWAWGNGANGQLGTGSREDAALPVRMDMPAGVRFTQIAVGGSKSFAIGTDGATYAWGRGFNGGLGTGSTANAFAPTAVQMPAGVSLEVLYDGSGDVMVARGSDGRLYAWGDGRFGQLGDGAGQSSSVPVQVVEPAGATLVEFSVGGSHVLATGSDGLLYGWGSGGSGRFGDGVAANRLVPTLVQGPDGLTLRRGATMSQASIVLASDGETYAVGSQNFGGELGDGTNQNSAVFVPVAVGAPVVESVTFGDVPGTDLAQDAATWTATTPPHPCGAVDVAVTSTQMDLSTTTVVPAGFTFGSPPVVTRAPAPATLTAGATTTLTAAATGDDAPTVQWQQRPAPTAPWHDVPGATTGTLTVTGDTTTEYQAVFTNCLGSVTAGPATVTVSAAPPAVPDPADPGAPAPADPAAPAAPEPAAPAAPEPPAPDAGAGDHVDTPPGPLAVTGSAALPLVLGASVLLLAGGAALAVRRLRGRA